MKEEQCCNIFRQKKIRLFLSKFCNYRHLTSLSFQRFMENTSTSVCLNELIAIEHGELRSQIKLQAAGALLVAAENVSDAVEITSEAYEVQVRGIYLFMTSTMTCIPFESGMNVLDPCFLSSAIHCSEKNVSRSKSCDVKQYSVYKVCSNNVLSSKGAKKCV